MSLQSKWFGFGLDESYDSGVRAFEQNRYEEAVDSLIRCLRERKDARTSRLARYYLAESYLRLGRMALQKSDPALAVSYFQSAVELQPSYADVHLALARAYGLVGERPLQESHLAKALELNPSYVEALMERARSQYALGRHEIGLGELRRAIGLDPSCDGEHYQIALELHAAGDHKGAAENIGKITPSVVGDAQVYASSGEVHAQAGRFAEAARDYERALELAPDYPDIRCRYGEALMQLDQVDRASEQFRKALDINPRYVEAYAQLGIALKRMSMGKDAQEAFKRALELDPHHVVASFEVTRR